MMTPTRLTFVAASHDSEVHITAKEIATRYRDSSSAMLAALKEQWTDESLTELNDMYGEQSSN